MFGIETGGDAHLQIQKKTLTKHLYINKQIFETHISSRCKKSIVKFFEKKNKDTADTIVNLYTRHYNKKCYYQYRT